MECCAYGTDGLEHTKNKFILINKCTSQSDSAEIEKEVEAKFKTEVEVKED